MLNVGDSEDAAPWGRSVSAQPDYYEMVLLDLRRRREEIDALIELLERFTEWAERHGISSAYVSDVLSNRRLPGKKITKALGLEKALLWRKSAAVTARGRG